MSPSRLSFEAGRDDDDVGRQRRSRGEADPVGDEAVDRVGGDRGAAGADRAEQVAVGNEADALVPGVVARREVGVRIAVGADLGRCQRDEALLDLGRSAAREPVVVRADQDVLPARDRVRETGGQDAQQHFRDAVARRPRDDVGRRALQHRHMRRRRGERGNERHRGRTAADDDDVLAGDIEPLGPELRVDERPAEVGLAGELGAIAPRRSCSSRCRRRGSAPATAPAHRRRGARRARSSRRRRSTTRHAGRRGGSGSCGTIPASSAVARM